MRAQSWCTVIAVPSYSNQLLWKRLEHRFSVFSECAPVARWLQHMSHNVHLWLFCVSSVVMLVSFFSYKKPHKYIFDSLSACTSPRATQVTGGLLYLQSGLGCYTHKYSD